LQACTTVTSNQKVNGDDPNMEDSPQAIKERMSPQEWNTIYKMSQDKALYQNLITSLFPTIHGNEEVRLKSVSQPAVMAP
jgi:DNA replication licensing factor MCM6